ncbi:hypothetical protein IJJ97_04145, partial [bacterium]|nr:hypothetical protein [bacterium]
MIEWWESLTLLQKIFVGCAAPSSLFMIITLIFSFITIEAENVFGNFDLDLDDPLGIFNLRGFMTFLSCGGLIGLALTYSSLTNPICIAGGVLSGGIAAKLVTALTTYLMKNEKSGNIKIENAIGQRGEVYLTIPANGKDQGKV